MKVLSSFDKGSLDLHLRAQQMFPLIPGGVPQYRHGGLVEQDLQLAARVAVNGAVAVEVHLAQWRPEAPWPPLGKKRQDTNDEERLTIPRSVSGYKDRTKTAIR